MFTDKERWLLRFINNGYFVETGWWNSFEKKAPFDSKNKPIPWLTYSAIEFLNKKLTKKLNVFEFGSGNSTLYFADKVNTVNSVEHDDLWFSKVKSNSPSNSKLYLEDINSGNYEKFLINNEDKYNIIIVDGRKRVECVKNSIQSLSEDGILILDDSQREKYKEADTFLTTNNFKKIEFWGIGPTYFKNKCTTIYYKENNCFEI